MKSKSKSLCVKNAPTGPTLTLNHNPKFKTYSNKKGFSFFTPRRLRGQTFNNRIFEDFEKLFLINSLYRLSYQWILGFFSSFSRFWGLSVKISPTGRLWKLGNLSGNMVTYRYQWFFIVITILSLKIVLSSAVRKKNRYLELKAYVILSTYWNFQGKKTTCFQDIAIWKIWWSPETSPLFGLFIVFDLEWPWMTS